MKKEESNKEFCRCCGATKNRCYDNGGDEQYDWYRCRDCHGDFKYRRSKQ